ncbi:sensor histidine kinase [Thermopirellula anaerolimosa]
MKIAVFSTAPHLFRPLESEGWDVAIVEGASRGAELLDRIQAASIWIVDSPRLPDTESVRTAIALANGKHSPQRILIRPRPRAGEPSGEDWADAFDDFLYDPVDLQELTDRLRTASSRLRRGAECDQTCAPAVRFHRVFENACVGVVICDFTGHILEANRQFAQMLGYRPDELQGASIADITHPDDMTRETETLTPLAEGRISKVVLEKRYLHKSGSVVWGRLYVSIGEMLKPGEGWGLALVEDITPTKLAEQAERESRNRWQSLVENLPDRIALVDSQFNLKYINRPIEPEALGSSILNLVDPQDRAACLAKLEQARDQRIVTSMKLRGGSGRIWYCRCVPQTSGDGSIHDLIIIGTDVTERYRIEAELRQKEACLRRLLDVSELDRRLVWDQLHNRLSQELTGLSLALDKLAATHADGDPDPVAGTAARIAKQCLTVCRNLADALHSGTLERFGLVPALEEYIQGLSSETGRIITFHAPNGVVSLLPHLATSLFRIAEQLLKTGRFAHETAPIELNLSCHEEWATLELFVSGGSQPTKDRVVFDPDLLVVRERALLLGGEFEVRESEDGVRWICRIPLTGGTT